MNIISHSWAKKEKFEVMGGEERRRNRRRTPHNQTKKKKPEYCKGAVREEDLTAL